MKSLKLVRELVGHFNRQNVEQLNPEMGRNNYFLNIMGPTTQIFVFQLLLDLHNNHLNKRHANAMKKFFSIGDLKFDNIGRLTALKTLNGTTRSSAANEEAEFSSSYADDCGAKELETETVDDAGLSNEDPKPMDDTVFSTGQFMSCVSKS